MRVSHLLEHMVVQGTERRTAQQIAMALESRGGSLDATPPGTSTAFQARVLDSDLPQALTCLTDLVRQSGACACERPGARAHVGPRGDQHVEDTPDDQVFDLAYKTLWPEHPYGYSILGTRDTSARMSTSDLKQAARAGLFPGQLCH